MISDDFRLLFSLNDDDIDMHYESNENKLNELSEKNEAQGWVIFRVCSGINLGSYVVDHCINMGYINTEQ